MRIGLQTWGTHGDILPFLALAGGLSARGHAVTLAVTSIEMKDYSSYGRSGRFEVVPVHDTYQRWGDDLLSRIKLQILNKGPMQQVTSLLGDLFEPAVDEMYEASRRLCEGSDVVLGHFLVHPLQLAALKRNCPHATMTVNPDTFSSRHRAPTGVPHLGKWMNRWWWKLVKAAANTTILKHVNRLRRREGWTAARDLFSEVWESKTLTLITASPTLFDRPSDWTDNLQMCGFFGGPEEAEEWVMPEDLRRFLGEGEPPVYMSFGSMAPAATLRETSTLFTSAARMAGCRAIVHLPWDSTADAAEYPDIYRIGRVPYHRVFPHCSLVVHHGGAGTTHSASLSGCPSVVVEHFGDQVFWGSQLKRLGLTTRVLHRRSVTARKLSAEIGAVLSSPMMKRKAREIGEAMRKENGVERAVELVEEYLAPASRTEH